MVLVSYPDAFAAMAELKRDMAILATSGRDWAERTKRLAARVPDLDIFSQGLIERMNGGSRVPARATELPPVQESTPATTLSPMPSIAPVRRKQERKRRQRDAVRRRQASASVGG
jgi:hypothetical protein